MCNKERERKRERDLERERKKEKEKREKSIIENAATKEERKIVEKYFMTSA